MFNYKISMPLACALLALAFVPVAAANAGALPITVIDDFDDGDISDWVFFQGNTGIGAGVVLDDRPQQGSHYFATNWVGDGRLNGVYGGAFRNFNNNVQPLPPSDPWLNLWIYRLSDSSADGYTLDIILREDLDGNGWTNGAEDSIGMETAFVASDFDDQWTLISLPLSGFTNRGTGGDGNFNGKLDEIAIILGSVQGTQGSTIEVDFDQLSFTSGGPIVKPLIVFDDMEHGDPAGNGWFKFSSNISSGGIDSNVFDLPPRDADAHSLQAGWGSGGTPGYFGGFGRSNPVDLRDSAFFSFWINPDAGQDYALDIRLRDDDNGNNLVDESTDDEFSYVCVISASGPCAFSNEGWQLVSAPLQDFTDSNPGIGNGILDASPVSSGGNGQLLETLFVISSNSGADISLRTDYWVFSDLPRDSQFDIVDDFESGLLQATDADGNSIGFVTFSDGSPVSATTTNIPPALRPGSDPGNRVLVLSGNVVAFAGIVHRFENAAADGWLSRDWSGKQGFSIWLYGQNTGNTLFLDLLDNRSPGSTSDDAERFSVSFIDNFSGWKLLEFPFTSFVRKDVGNGAPDDGLTLTEVNGWALGLLGSGGEVTYYADNAELFGAVAPPELRVEFSANSYNIDEGANGLIKVKLNRPLGADDPPQVSIDYAASSGGAIPDRDYAPVFGTLSFIKNGPSELSFPLPTFDNSKWQGDRRVNLLLANPVDVTTGFQARAQALIIDDESPDADLLDDFERSPALWSSADGIILSARELAGDDPQALPGQGSYEGVLQVDFGPAVEAAIDVKSCKKARKRVSKKKRKKGKYLIPVTLFTTANFDALTVDHTTVKLGRASEAHVSKRGKIAKRHEKDVDKDGDLDLVFHFRADKAGVTCGSKNLQLEGLTGSGEAFTTARPGLRFGRDFPAGSDWSQAEALSMWYYGSGNGETVRVQIKDNRAPDPGPAGWNLVWGDEFNDPADTPPNPENWGFDLGDLDDNGSQGWGKSERQYYTDLPANAATDGLGNMRISAIADESNRACYYGPCEFTSARLTTKHRAEFGFGRIEARIRVPEAAGLSSDLRSQGTSIDQAGWPQAGEINLLGHVGRTPGEIYGAINGPGYSGGASYASFYDFGEPVATDFHSYSVEWQQNLISWYVDGILYHQATAADVAPNEWVFNAPQFLLLSLAVGGNFGGVVDAQAFPQSMLIDYIRVYQAPDSAERFETSFVDKVAGWQSIVLPFSAFTRSAEQPPGAPDDGLGLSETWGYDFYLPAGSYLLLDQLRLQKPAL